MIAWIKAGQGPPGAQQMLARLQAGQGPPGTHPATMPGAPQAIRPEIQARRADGDILLSGRYINGWG